MSCPVPIVHLQSEHMLSGIGAYLELKGLIEHRIQGLGHNLGLMGLLEPHSAKLKLHVGVRGVEATTPPGYATQHPPQIDRRLSATHRCDCISWTAPCAPASAGTSSCARSTVTRSCPSQGGGYAAAWI
jgi:hypothetical protein